MPTLLLLFKLVLKHWLSQRNPSGTSLETKVLKLAPYQNVWNGTQPYSGREQHFRFPGISAALKEEKKHPVVSFQSRQFPSYRIRPRVPAVTPGEPQRQPASPPASSTGGGWCLSSALIAAWQSPGTPARWPGWSGRCRCSCGSAGRTTWKKKT